MLEYSAILICQPHEFYCLDPGGQFQDGRWYSAQTEDRLTKSVELIADEVSNSLIPWYECSFTPEGFLDTYNEYLEQNSYLAHSGHSEFTLACAYAMKNIPTLAERHAEQAIADFESIYNEMPACDWALEGVSKCRQLLDALTVSTTENLLSEWRSHTINALKLQPLVHSESEG